ncbi:unnamed protein product [Adineta steineri]|uniref:Beta-lactamase-related domain-containing protein n=1 Tax=Adineta steineri TaxID=433720 RepID=A0A818SQ07_9BILA|nr:unnamed protein product [Adineta steineri]CAF3668922.1 unnamed protein product [Adineta steineri]
MMLFSFILFAILFINVNSSSSNCTNRELIEQSLNKVHIPGAVIIVVDANNILYEQAFGYQSLTSLKPMNIDQSIFALASISKTFIAVAVMQLVEKKLVNLDTDINMYLSDNRKIFHPIYTNNSITLRKLLSHSASIAVDSVLQSTFFQPGDNAFLKETLSDLCFKYLNPNTSNWLPRPPGNVTFYSNEGTSLAALVVERITKMSYDKYVEENIFKPLNIDISKTGVRLSDFSNTNEFVEHYAYNASLLPLWNQEFPLLNITQMKGNLSTWLHISLFGFSGYPAGLLRMSARSLSLFLRMFINNGYPLLSSESIIEMKTIVGNNQIYPYQPNFDNNSSQRLPARRYGLCWNWRTLSDGRQYIGHGGTLPGMTHLMLVNEKHNTGVIILTNSDTNAPIDLTPQIFETIENIHMSLFKCFEKNHANSFLWNSNQLFWGFYVLFIIFNR